MLELQIGMIGWASTTGEPWTENWSEVAGVPGGAWRLCEQAVSSMNPSLGSAVTALLESAQPIREARNKFAHAIFILDLERPGGDQWVLRSARDTEFKPLSEAEGAVLVSEANRLSQLARDLSQRAVSETGSRA